MNPAPREVLLVGIDHRIQYTNDSCGVEWIVTIRNFQDYLVSQVLEHSVTLIAEEFNEELLAKNKAYACTARDAAARCGCQHIFCEPTQAERATFDASSLSDARESAWLDCLQGTTAYRILFVCGNDHLASFLTKLQVAGFSVVELSRGWGNGWEVTQ